LERVKFFHFRDDFLIKKNEIEMNVFL